MIGRFRFYGAADPIMLDKLKNKLQSRSKGTKQRFTPEQDPQKKMIGRFRFYGAADQIMLYKLKNKLQSRSEGTKQRVTSEQDPQKKMIGRFRFYESADQIMLYKFKNKLQSPSKGTKQVKSSTSEKNQVTSTERIQESMHQLDVSIQSKQKNEQKTIEEGVPKNTHKSKFMEVGVSEDKQKIVQDSIRSVANDEWVSSHFVSVNCEPVIEILGVTLLKENASSSLKVCGDIYVKDSEDDKSGSIYLYQRCDGSEISDGTLSLTWPDEGISAMAEPQICLNIRDRNLDEGILIGSASLVDKTSAITDDNVEKYRTTIVRGTDWSANVKFLELSFGVFAYVVVQLEEKENLSKEGKEDQHIKVYGSVSAEYRLSFSNKGIERVERITLFEIPKDSNAFECVTLGSSITMSRSVLACPAYSSLTINVKLNNRMTDDVIVEQSANFQASNADEFIVFHGSKNIDARVLCCWEESRMLRELHASETTVPIWVDTCLGSTSPAARNLVEVFSLLICLQNNMQLKLSGMVSFSNCDGYHILFRRDKNNPFILPSGCNLLPMEGPSYPLVPQEHFLVSVDLEDFDNNVSIKGLVHSDPRLDRQRKPWYNRLLSCVIKGKNDCGIAVVHYTVFASALMASLKLHFFIKGEVSPHTRIHGSLIANYSDYGCKTPYERYFHRIVLFERRSPLKISSNKYDLELLRHALAVPYDSALQITADLTCVSLSGIPKTINGTLVIKPGNDENNVVTSQGGEIGICVDVKWGTYMRGKEYLISKFQKV